MSKIDSNGLEHGKRGNNIYVGLNNQQVKKGLYRPTNPRTPAQQRHRAKLAFANRLSAHLSEAVNLGFARAAEETKGLTPRNAFVKANWDNGAMRWNEETSLWELCPEQLLLAQGPRHIPAGITAELDGNLLRITCPDAGLYEMHAVPDDQLLVADVRLRFPDACLCLVLRHLLPSRHRHQIPSPPRPIQPQPLSRHLPFITFSRTRETLILSIQIIFVFLHFANYIPYTRDF